MTANGATKGKKKNQQIDFGSQKDRCKLNSDIKTENKQDFLIRLQNDFECQKANLSCFEKSEKQ